MTLSGTIFRNVTVTFAGRLYSSLLTFAVVALLLPRVLSRESFGLYSFYSTLFVILAVVIDFGANTIAVRDGSKDPDRLGGLLRALFVLRLILSSLCVAAAIALACLFEESVRVRLLVSGASLHLLFHALGGFGVIFHVRMKFALLVLASGVGQTLFFGATLALFLAGRTAPLEYLFAFGGGLALSNTVTFLLARKLAPRALRRAGDGLLRLAKEAFPLGISAILSILYFHVDTLLLRPIRGEGDVGLYTASYRIVTFAVLFPALFQQVLLPVYSRFAAREPRMFRRVVTRSVLYMGMISIPAAAALAVLSGPVLRLIYPPEYAAAADCLALLGVAVAFIFVSYPHVSALIASGRQATFTMIALAGLVMNVFLNLSWIPARGIEGAALATVVTEGFVLATAALCVRKQIGFFALSPATAGIVPVAAAAGGAAWLFRDAPLVAVLPGLGLLLAGALYLFRLLPFNIDDEDRA